MKEFPRFYANHKSHLFAALNYSAKFESWRKRIWKLDGDEVIQQIKNGNLN
jgi:hypothetical protein